jgi:predicted porin
MHEFCYETILSNKSALCILTQLSYLLIKKQAKLNYSRSPIMYYKSLLAIAVASTVFSQTSMAMPSADFYGFVDIGLEKYNENDIINGSDIYPGLETPNGNTAEQEFALNNNVQSRLGIKGEEDISDGWKGTYRMEFQVNVLESGGEAMQTRLGWLGLTNGDHSFKVGTQWTPYMEYSGWNTNRSEAQGVASYFYVTDELEGSIAYGFRSSSTASYTFGGGGWGTGSPITATVALHIADDSRKTELAGNDELTNVSGITGVTLAAASTFGMVTVNAVYVKNIVEQSDAAKTNIKLAEISGDLEDIEAAYGLVTEPSIYSIGAKVQATPELEFGFAYRGADRDLYQNNSTVQSTTVSTQYQITENINIHLGYAQGEDSDKTQRQLENNVFGQVWYQITDSRSMRLEFENVDYGSDGDANVVLVSMRQNF